MDAAFGVFNFGITLGYLFIAIAVLPHIDVRRNWVKVAAVLFFVTCGITHGEMAYYALFHEHHPITGWSTANHLIQVVAVWVFVFGLYKEFVGDRLLTASDSETLQHVADGVDRLERGARDAQLRADVAHDEGGVHGEAADAGMMSGGDNGNENEKDDA